MPDGGINARFYFSGGYCWIRVVDSAQWGLGGSIYIQHGDDVYYLLPTEIVYHSKTSATVSGILQDGSAIIEVYLSTAPMGIAYEVTSILEPDERIDNIPTTPAKLTANPYCKIIPRGKLVPLESAE